MNRKLFGVLVLLCGCGGGPAEPRLEMGGSAILMLPGGQDDVSLGTTADNYNELMRYFRAKDVRGFFDMANAGKVFVVSPRTKCIVNGRPGFSLVSVRITSGDQAGKEGVIDREFVIPDGSNSGK